MGVDDRREKLAAQGRGAVSLATGAPINQSAAGCQPARQKSVRRLSAHTFRTVLDNVLVPATAELRLENPVNGQRGAAE